MKIAVTSDLHGSLPKIDPCDILLICGDLVPLYYQTNMIASENWFWTDFFPWCRDSPAKNVVFIAGNHDFILERCYNKMYEAFNNWRKHNIYYLNNSSIEIEGIKIFGTPYCKIFGHWAFMRENDRLQKYYSEIPENLDILISHDAQKLDALGVISEGWQTGVDAGNEELAKAIIEKAPKYAFCGHIHSGNHTLQYVTEHTQAANASLVDEGYNATNPILYFDYETTI